MALTATRTARSERDRILAALLAEVDELAERALARMPEEIPAYRGRDEAFFADVQDQLAGTTGPSWPRSENRPLTREDLAFARPCALRRASDGIALEDFLHAFRIGRQVFWQAVLEQAGDSPGGHEAALELATPVMRYSDIAATHASRAYVEYQQHLVADADRERRDLLEPPAGRRAADAPAAARRGPVVRADRPGAGDRGQRDAGDPGRRRAARRGRGAGAGRRPDRPGAGGAPAERAGRGRRAAPGRPGADAADVCDRLQETQRRLRIGGVPIAVGVGTVAAGIAELPRSYQEATRRWPTWGSRAGWWRCRGCPRSTTWPCTPTTPRAGWSTRGCGRSWRRTGSAAAG